MPAGTLMWIFDYITEWLYLCKNVQFFCSHHAFSDEGVGWNNTVIPTQYPHKCGYCVGNGNQAVGSSRSGLVKPLHPWQVLWSQALSAMKAHGQRKSIWFMQQERQHFRAHCAEYSGDKERLAVCQVCVLLLLFCFFVFFYCCLGKRSNFVLGISSAVGCLRLSLSNLYLLIFPAKVLTEMSLKCIVSFPFKAKSDATNASGCEK